MKITVIVGAIEGLVDADIRPTIVPGHLTLTDAYLQAKKIGSGYPHCSCVECPEHENAAFYANFSNEENPPLSAAGTVEYESKGHLELWFHHDEVANAILNHDQP